MIVAQRPSAPAVEVTRLHKAYGRHIAVHDLNLKVEPGEVFGFLGPIGAGKSTTIKILLGLVRPTSGRASVFGLPASDPGARRLVGYLPENCCLQDWLTGNELLELHADLSGLSAQERSRRIPEVLRLVGLDGRGDERLCAYSKGMRQRIGLAQAIVHDPRLLLLDEPASALDPIERREVRDLIRALSARGTTVFMSSHLLSEVEMVCDRVTIVDRGRVVKSGRLDDLVRGAPQLTITVDCVNADVLTMLGRFGRVLSHDRTSVRLGVTDVSVASVIAEVLPRSGYRVYSLTPVQRSLEDVYTGLGAANGGEL